MNNKNSLNLIFDLNEKYEANNCNGIVGTGNNYRIIPGKFPILLSAPHAVNQYRSGELKFADRFTGAIVELLCRLTGAYGIIRTFNLQDDPNSENAGLRIRI